jgi:hypothetical protein
MPMANPLLVGPDTAIGLTQGTKSNAALDSRMIPDLKTLGIRWLRWQPYAYSIEKSQGVYTWGNLDSVVSQCNAQGINLMLTVLFPPAWGMSGGFPTPAWSLQFAQAMCSRYDGNHGHGQIQGVELGNEDYTISGDNPTALAATMAHCYQPLKTAYPNLVVGPGCCIHRNKSVVPGYYQTLWQKAPAQFDYINFHFYTQNNNSSDPSIDGSGFYSYDTLIAALQQANNNAGHSHFPIWITETGWPVNTNGFTAPYVVSPTTQSNYLKYVLDRSKALSNQPIKIFLYTLAYFDFGAPSTGIGHSQGMSLYQVAYSGNPTPAYTMVAGYPKTWGGGSSTVTATKDITMRARVRIGAATQIKDIALRAGVKSAAASVIKDIVLRAPIAGGLYDTFVRANQPQWGNSTGGDNWIQAGGTAVPSIVSNEGQLTGATGTNTFRLGSQTLADVDAQVRFSITQAGDIVGLTLRDTGLNNFVRLRLTATQLQIVQQTPSGGFVILTNYAFVPTASTFYRLRFRAQGTLLQGKIWIDGTAEPANWLTQYSPCTVTGAGQVGLSVALSQTSDIVLFDHFVAANASTTTQTPNTSTRDIKLRARVLARSTTQINDIALRARIVDLNAITTQTYAAKRPPLQRRFPKS